LPTGPIKWRSFWARKIIWGGRSTWGIAFLEVQEVQGILLYIHSTLIIADDNEWSWHGTWLRCCSKCAGSHQLLHWNVQWVIESTAVNGGKLFRQEASPLL
jgi:hypothetical protein